MAQYKRLPKNNDDIRGDEFISFFDKLFHRLYDHRAPLIMVVLIVSVGVVSFFALKNYQESKTVTLNQQLYEIKKQPDPLKAYESFVSQSSKVAGLARVGLIDYFLSQSQVAGLKDHLDQAIRSSNKTLASILKLSRAQWAWQEEGAQAGLTQIEALDEIAGLSALAKGDLLADQKNKDQAGKIYQELAAQDEDSFLKNAAQARLLWMKVHE